MSCKFYTSKPSYYGSCTAKKEKARIEAGRGVEYESDGYITYNEWKTYECSSGSSKYENCPYRRNREEGCFVTTACVKAKSLSDNCYELETLRMFRDTYVKLQPNGEEEIALYYETAPIIVEKINELFNGNQIFCNLYQELVLPCVKLIEEKEYESAYERYRNITLRLKEEYVDK